MTELKKMTELNKDGRAKKNETTYCINQAQRRGKGSDATPFFFVVRTLVLERFSAVLIPPVFLPT
jgi:hypothetical protein